MHPERKKQIRRQRREGQERWKERGAVSGGLEGWVRGLLCTLFGRSLLSPGPGLLGLLLLRPRASS